MLPKNFNINLQSVTWERICGDLLEGIHGRCRNIGFVVCLTCFFLVKTCWILFVSLSNSRGGKQGVFLVRHLRHLKNPADTSALSLSMMSDIYGVKLVTVYSVWPKPWVIIPFTFETCRYIPMPWDIAICHQFVFNRKNLHQQGELKQHPQSSIAWTCQTGTSITLKHRQSQFAFVPPQLAG